MYQLIQQAPLRWPDPVKHGIHVSEEAKDLITSLLMKDRKKRLGQKGDCDEVLAHPFFSGLDMDKLLEREIKAEFCPQIDNTGLNNFDSDITQEKPEESHVPAEVLEKIKKAEDNFKDFGFS